MMNRRDEKPDNETQLAAPQRLAHDLRGVYRAEIPVPPEVDESVLQMARIRLTRPALVLRLAPAFAAAAAVFIAACILFLIPYLRGPNKFDIDSNGKVDILDAFTLARRVETSSETKTEWDVNHDGLVNRQDVDRVAMAAVSLGVQ